MSKRALISLQELGRQLAEITGDADVSPGIPPACYADDDLLPREQRQSAHSRRDGTEDGESLEDLLGQLIDDESGVPDVWSRLSERISHVARRSGHDRG